MIGVLLSGQSRVAGQLVDSLVRIAALHAVPCLLQLDYWLGESSKVPSRLQGPANRRTFSSSANKGGAMGESPCLTIQTPVGR